MAPRPRLAAPLAGLAAGAVTLGVAEVLAALLVRAVDSTGTPSPLLAVGGAFVDRTPLWLKNLAVDLFGTNDKVALFVGMGVTLAVVCALLGWLAVRRRTLALVLFAAVGVVGSAAVLSRPGAGPVDVVPTVVGAAAGLTVLSWLAGRISRLPTAPGPEGGIPGPGESTEEDSATRRGVLLAGGGLATAGVLGIVVGRFFLQEAEVVQAARSQVGRQLRSRRRAPLPAGDAAGATATASPTTEPLVPADADFGLRGLADYVTPNDSFYRIDTALSVPQVDPETWTIRVHGMVETEVEMTFEELLEEELVDAVVTLTCVSNEVGGDLIGNAVWTGWPIRELLARAGVSPDADMVLSTSVDGFTAGTPLEVLTDDRAAILAVAMNDEPLPPQHGFPVRMVVPGLYGYVSATKWVVDLEVTRFDRDQGYWTPRGWAERGPVKVQSRIDVPRAGAELEAGTLPVAGVAWDQHTGIERVEVRIDDGQWQQAELAAEPTVDAWRQWRLPWDAQPGSHRIQVRATNRDGETQTSQTSPPAPDGATGWHTVEVTVA